MNQIVNPIKINKLRKQQFTEKRNPYKRYIKTKWNWTDIFNEIESLKNEESKVIKE